MVFKTPRQRKFVMRKMMDKKIRYYYIEDMSRYPITKRKFYRMKGIKGNVLSIDTYY
jgi:hypothetical protein